MNNAFNELLSPELVNGWVMISFKIPNVYILYTCSSESRNTSIISYSSRPTPLRNAFLVLCFFLDFSLFSWNDFSLRRLLVSYIWWSLREFTYIASCFFIDSWLVGLGTCCLYIPNSSSTSLSRLSSVFAVRLRWVWAWIVIESFLLE